MRRRVLRDSLSAEPLRVKQLDDAALVMEGPKFE